LFGSDRNRAAQFVAMGQGRIPASIAGLVDISFIPMAPLDESIEMGPTADIA
jgi:hypothetical protein